MEQSISGIPAEVAGVLHLGMVLGQNQTFGLMAGRCSAAQAEALLRLREEKLYLPCAATWQDFCPRYLNMSRKQADYIIRLWQQFGAGFFELAQLTRISAQTYRAIEPAIRDGALHFNEEAIEIDPENAQKIAAAVSELRRTLPAREKPEPTIQERLAALEKRCAAIASEFAEISRHPCQEEDRVHFALALGRASAALRQIESQHAVEPALPQPPTLSQPALPQPDPQPPALSQSALPQPDPQPPALSQSALPQPDPQPPALSQSALPQPALSQSPDSAE